jgi:hypothetical protein
MLVSSRRGCRRGENEETLSLSFFSLSFSFFDSSFGPASSASSTSSVGAAFSLGSSGGGAACACREPDQQTPEVNADRLTWLRDILIVLVLILRSLLPLALFTFLGLRFGGAKFFIEQIIRVDLGRLLRCAYIAFGVGSLRVRSFTGSRTIGEGYVSILLLLFVLFVTLFPLGRLDRRLYTSKAR